MRKTLVLICLGLVLPGVASAKRENPLEGQPAVRHKEELRKGRFEIGPGFNFSLNRFLRHQILFGLKLEYHINDYFSIGADIGYGVGLNTGMSDELAAQFSTPDDQALWGKLKKRFSDVQLAGDVRFSFTPMSGKLALFSKLFMAYDFYIFAGFGFGLTKHGDGSVSGDYALTSDDDIDKAVAGFHPGFVVGLGMHIFFARWMSMGIEVKDLGFADNESGGDFTRGLKPDEIAKAKILVNGDDNKFANHVFIGINFTFYLPPSVEISK